MKLFLRLSLILTSIIFTALSSSAYYENAGGESPYIPSVLIVESDEEAADLEAQGVIIWRRRADMALALVPRNSANRVKTRGDIGGKRPRRACPTMDIAKSYFDASLINAGTGLPQAYKGKNVVVGFCDIAFDPNHINFRDTEGRSRVKRLLYYDEPLGIRKVLDTPEEIASWTTDYDGAYHGTHVAGIMTGSYNANGYGGMAPEAEIVATTSQLYDAGILSACEDIIEYAKSVGKPAVINLSVGSYNGPHDGTSLFCRYMELLGEEAVICLASGNEGDDYNSYRFTFTEKTPAWRVRIYGNDWVNFNIHGMTDAWSSDTRPVSARFIIYDNDNAKCVYESELVDFSKGEEFVLSCDSDPGMSRYMTGKVYFFGYISDLNGRWVTEIVYDTQTTATAAASDGRWARYHPALEFSASPGTHVDINADGQYSALNVMSGYPAPTADLSVSDLATSHNVVTVGMYNNRTRIPTLSGEDRVFNFEPLTVNTGSGYGTLIDGRVLPHTLAPGGGVVSSSNRYYTLAHPEFIPRMNAVETIDGETYYWGSDAGTSMSTPYVAGVIATWLEAVPGLTVADVLEAIRQTNLHEYPDPSNPRHGQGWFQPYEGLKYVLAHAGICPGTTEATDIRIVLKEGMAEVLNPSASEIEVNAYSVSGSRALLPVRSSDTVVPVSLDALESGVYMIHVTPRNGSPVTLKIVI